jgi:hypothetical protein
MPDRPDLPCHSSAEVAVLAPAAYTSSKIHQDYLRPTIATSRPSFQKQESSCLLSVVTPIICGSNLLAFKPSPPTPGIFTKARAENCILRCAVEPHSPLRNRNHYRQDQHAHATPPAADIHARVARRTPFPGVRERRLPLRASGGRRGALGPVAAERPARRVIHVPGGARDGKVDIHARPMQCAQAGQRGG